MKHLLTFLRHGVSATLALTVGSPSFDRRYSALKHLAFMLLFLLGSLNVWGEQIVITANSSFSPTLPTTAASVHTEATANTVEGLEIKEVGLYKNGTTYIMFKQNVGYIYNTTSLGTINSVSIAYNSDCSTSAKAGVYFGSSEMSTYTTTSNSTVNKTSGDSWKNTTSGNGYFQLSTNNKNCQIKSITIDYTPGDPSKPTV